MAGSRGEELMRIAQGTSSARTTWNSGANAGFYQLFYEQNQRVMREYID
jgi:hypothetical protein